MQPLLHQDGSCRTGGGVRTCRDGLRWYSGVRTSRRDARGTVLQRVLELRTNFEEWEWTRNKQTGVQNAFGRTPADPGGATTFKHVLGGYLFVNLRFQSRRRGKSRWWSVESVAMRNTQRITTGPPTSFSQAGDRVVDHVTIEPNTEYLVVRWPT